MTDMEEKDYQMRLMKYELEKDFTDKVNDDEFWDRIGDVNTSEELGELFKDIDERTAKYGRLVKPSREEYEQINRNRQEVH